MSSTTTSILTVRIRNESKNMLEDAARLGNSTLRGILEDMAEKIYSGEIEVKNNKLVLSTGYDLSRLLEVCDHKGIDPQDAIEKVAQSMWRE